MVSLKRGDVVWGHWKKKTWWPAVVVSPEDCNQDSVATNKKWLFWFGDHHINELLCKNIVPFKENYGTKLDRKNKSAKYTNALKETFEALATQCGVKYRKPDSLFLWAKNGFKHSTKRRTQNSELPESVRKCLAGEAFKRKDIDYSDIFEDYDSGRANVIEELVLSIRKGSKDLNDICICCKSRNKVAAQHPLFQGGVCSFCLENIKSLRTVPLKKMADFCIVCGKHGMLFSCKNDLCRRSYCRLCLDYLVQEGFYMQTVDEKNWFCFSCVSKPDENILIKVCNLVEPNFDGSSFPKKKSGVSVFAYCNGVRRILEDKKLRVKQFCTYDSKQSLISINDEEIKYKHFSEKKFGEIAANLVCGGYFPPYNSGQERKEYMDAFIEDFYGFTFPLNNAKLANSSLLFIYVSATEALDSVLFNRVLRFLEVQPISVKCNQKLFSVWTNIFNYRFTANRTFSIKKKPAHDTAESIFSYFLEPLKGYFESVA